MPKPICVPCQRFFRVKKNGFGVTEMMPMKDGAKPGKETPELWTPYKLWVGDLWECEGCNTQIVVGIPSTPVAEHFQPEFMDWRAKLDAGFQVNDC